MDPHMLEPLDQFLKTCLMPTPGHGKQLAFRVSNSWRVPGVFLAFHFGARRTPMGRLKGQKGLVGNVVLA